MILIENLVKNTFCFRKYIRHIHSCLPAITSGLEILLPFKIIKSIIKIGLLKEARKLFLLTDFSKIYAGSRHNNKQWIKQ